MSLPTRTPLRRAPARPRPRVAGVLLACAVTACGPRPELRSADGAPAESVVLPTARCGDHFVAPATTPEGDSLLLLLDTGTPRTLLDARLAPRYADRDGFATLAVGGMTIRRTTRFRYADLSAVGRALGVRLDGILGYDAFRGVVQVWDFPAGEVRVRLDGLPRSGPGVVPMARYDRPVVRARIAGRDERVMIDTGLSDVASLEAFDALPLATPPVRVEGRVRVGRSVPVRMARLDGDVLLGDLRIERPVVRDAVDGSLLGVGALAGLVVELDRAGGRARILEPDGRAPASVVPSPRVSAGVIGTLGRTGLVVREVAADGPAARAGVRAGDRIVAVDGVPVPPARCAEVRAPSTEVDPVRWTVDRDGTRFDARVVPEPVVR